MVLISRSVLLANSFVISDKGDIEIDPFDNQSDDSMGTGDDVEWSHDEHRATWNMDLNASHNVTDSSAGKSSVGDESPVENWD